MSQAKEEMRLIDMSRKAADLVQMPAAQMKPQSRVMVLEKMQILYRQDQEQTKEAISLPEFKTLIDSIK